MYASLVLHVPSCPLYPLPKVYALIRHLLTAAELLRCRVEALPHVEQALRLSS